MYIPTHFRETDLARLDWLAAHDAFGTLVTLDRAAPFATHLPVLYHRQGERVTLTGHWARPNPQWGNIEAQRALFIFHGPHAYVSPRWYTDPARNVPTWNYAAAHLYGQVRLIEEEASLARIVTLLARQYEAGAVAPWRFEDAIEGSARLRGIIGFELDVDEIELKFKLNQNQPPANIKGVIDALGAQGSDDAAAVAALMQEVLARRNP